MKRLLITSLLALTSSLANAVPNVWTDILRQGGYNVVIESASNEKLDVGCYIDSEQPKWHNIEVTYKGKAITNSEKKQPLSFFINDSESFKPIPTSKVYVDVAHWNSFVDSLVTAKKIEVYNNNKLIFTVMPRNGKTIKDIEGCYIL
ncbi:hypothetical protein HX127_08815 [Acinetobacter sp. 256-1]|uniref:hypothetical protein n=1 Tax=Acinetobacter sp. 256-1 TaxID=2746721 RepID=UPI0025769D1A|nr:hypothetical protein [Acinetobacter sp. 256-1]MDM1757669.1 hypothetical protein [Acinetobacter sp. 256-1]